ncbi:MAG: family 43 glycosylhydrolase [Prevotella sp.]|jgi:beta-xylosidase
MKRTLTLILMLGLLTAAGAKKKQQTATVFDGYLFAYFEGGGDNNLQEQLRFAVSEDARNWYALNGNRPVVASDTISESGGIRDPHILRGEDGCYYIVATDMMVAKNGWNENPGIVMMKSKDLVNWTHGKVNLAKDWPAFSDAYWVWAPQTIYDRKAKKYMIYFTLQRTGDNRQSLITFYAYANKDFTAFESEPRQLFAAKYGSIDNDIIEKDGTYHLFYKGNTKDENGKEVKNGIQQATSKNLKGPWKEDFEYLDAYAGTRTHVEGSSVFPLHDGSGDWILMYDLYGSGRYEYQTSRDIVHFTKEPQSFRKDFFPRHGSVISVTKEELERIQQKWGWVLKHEFESYGNPIIRHKHTADPAVCVEGDTLWLFAGHDMQGGQTGYVMKDWLLYSTTDMKHWTEYPSPLHIDDFKWAKSKQAYAGHVAKGKDGRYYWYVSTNWCGIGVAVSDKITGPYKDALGKPLLTNEQCFASNHSWACIDPAILIDDDGTPYIIWGNRQCYYAKLKDNMTEIDGDIHQIDVPRFTEAPWMHKYNGKYYLTYASEWPEKIAYAVSEQIGGPYTPMGIISEIAGNSNTTHPAIVNYKGQWLFFSHNGGLSDGTSYSRSVIAEPMHYLADGSIRRIPATAGGVAEMPKMAAYLMVYHKDADHSLHMALSRDGYSWKALNGDRPVVSGDTIAQQHGIRDPHIYRGPDGTFYIAMTDLHIFGQREGFRDTEWERDGKEYGWGNNRGLVLMKSKDLINWTHTVVRIDEAFPERFGKLGCAWAPETIWDPEEGKLMVYFTIRPTGKGKTKLYYAYANNDFTKLITEPELLFEYPDEKVQILDADIIPMPDGRYCMTYCSQEGPAGIKMAISDHINRGYQYQAPQIDAEPRSCEAPTMYKLIGQDKWILMYDIFSIKPHNFGFMETTDFNTFKHIGHFGDGPTRRDGFSEQKHGAVTVITEEEASNLENYWK